jgi:hypothetical protein
VGMQQAVSQSLYSYWNALRGNRPAPRRFEIEPSRIATSLPDTFILERINHTNLRFRLAGTRITEALGFELRGKNLFELFDADDSRVLQEQITTITESCAVGLFRVSAENAEGQTTTFEMTVMPLMHMHDAVDRFLGSISSIDKPDWLGSCLLEKRKLVHHEVIWPTGGLVRQGARASEQLPVLSVRREARIVRSARRQFRVYDGGLSQAGEEG